MRRVVKNTIRIPEEPAEAIENEAQAKTPEHPQFIPLGKSR